MRRLAAALGAVTLAGCAAAAPSATGTPAQATARVPSGLPASLGVPEDAMTMQIYRLGASNQDPSAQFEIGVLYEKGEDFPHDMGEAVRWYTKSAAQGYPKAAYNLGLIYARGAAGKPDPVAAYVWLARAAKGLSTGEKPRAERALALERSVMTDAELAAAKAQLAK